MFPYEGMPVAAQWISEALPATHFMRIIRGVVLRGADLMELWRDTIWLLGFTVVGLVVALCALRNHSIRPETKMPLRSIRVALYPQVTSRCWVQRE